MYAGRPELHEPETLDDDPELAAIVEQYQKLTAEMVLSQATDKLNSIWL